MGTHLTKDDEISALRALATILVAAIQLRRKWLSESHPNCTIRASDATLAEDVALAAYATFMEGKS